MCKEDLLGSPLDLPSRTEIDTWLQGSLAPGEVGHSIILFSENYPVVLGNVSPFPRSCRSYSATCEYENQTLAWCILLRSRGSLCQLQLGGELWFSAGTEL